MVVKVKLEGLNVVRARGKYYVYHRDSGEVLLRGFDGSRDALERRLAEPDMMATYNNRRARDLKHTYPAGTLGSLVQWFENDCPRYQNLSDATKKDYAAAFLYLHDKFDAPLETITQPALYETRDKCAARKWPRFADKMMAALSSMFSEAVKRGKMITNPAKGIDKANKADPNANREWSAQEWQAVIERAPLVLKTPLMLARYAGFRGQTIAALQWRQYQVDPRFGKCFRLVAKKNNEQTWIPAMPELQSFMDGLDRTSLNIATRADGTPWQDEKQMQTAVSHWLKALEREGVVGAGVTLHGLRVTYAADLRRGGANASDVSAALGDRSERMGEHYTRHVENESKVIRAFEGKAKR
jgi:integrase